MRPTLEDEWDLEPWVDDPDGVDAHYTRESSEPEIDDEDREIWLYGQIPQARRAGDLAVERACRGCPGRCA